MGGLTMCGSRHGGSCPRCWPAKWPRRANAGITSTTRLELTRLILLHYVGRLKSSHPAGDAYDPLTLKDPPDLDGVRHEYVDAGGLRTHVDMAGPGHAPPILLVPGWPQNWWPSRADILELSK